MGCCSSDTSGADNQAPLIAASPRRATRYKEVGYNPYGATAVSEADDRGMDHHVGTGAGSSGAAATGAGGPGHHGQQQYQRRSDASSMASMLDDEDGGDDEPQPDRKKSLKKLKTHKKGTRRYVLHQKIRKIFEEKRNRLHEVVKLPQGEDKNECVSLSLLRCVVWVTPIVLLGASSCMHMVYPRQRVALCMHVCLWCSRNAWRCWLVTDGLRST